MPFANCNGAHVWYDDGWGVDVDDTAEPLIFHHGFTASRVNWGYDEGGAAWLLGHDAAFHGRYRCIFVESRGCGDSSMAPGPYTIQQQAADVLALADHLGLGSFSFCGHSMGGGTGFWLAVHHPHRIRRLVALAPVPSGGFPRATTKMRIRNKHPIDQWFGYEPKPTLEELEERYAVLGEARPADTPHWQQERANAVDKVPSQYWREAWLSIVTLRLTDRLAALKGVPILVIAGATDSLLAANVADAARCQDGVLHVLSAAGHETARDDPLGVARAIDGFVSGCAPSAKKLESGLKERMDRWQQSRLSRL